MGKRYIDADALMKELSTMYKQPKDSEDYMNVGYDHAIADAVITVHEHPTADVVERKRGKWKNGYCSECGYNWGKDALIASVPNFCPNCGAEMVKGEDDD